MVKNHRSVARDCELKPAPQRSAKNNQNLTKLMRILSRKLIVGLLGCFIVSASVHGATYPYKPVTIVVPYTAGGVTDVFGRAILPYKDLADVLKIASEKPGALLGASSGNGSIPHVAAPTRHNL